MKTEIPHKFIYGANNDRLVGLSDLSDLHGPPRRRQLGRTRLNEDHAVAVRVALHNVEARQIGKLRVAILCPIDVSHDVGEPFLGEQTNQTTELLDRRGLDVDKFDAGLINPLDHAGLDRTCAGCDHSEYSHRGIGMMDGGLQSYSFHQINEQDYYILPALYTVGMSVRLSDLHIGIVLRLHLEVLLARTCHNARLNGR